MSVIPVTFEHEAPGDLFMPTLELPARRHAVCLRKVDRGFRAQKIFVPAMSIGFICILAVKHKRGESPWCDRLATTTPMDTEILFPQPFTLKAGDYVSLKVENISPHKITYSPLILGLDI